MNKSQLIKAVAEKSDLTQKQVSEAWDLIEATILETLASGEKVQLSGFGSFEVRERAERAGRNPKTGEVVTVPACKYPAFVAAKAVKEKQRRRRDPSARLRFEVLVRDRSTCRLCGASPLKDPSVTLHIDHIIPWSKGGDTTMENLQTLCSKCNLGKSDIIIE